jgi:phosphoglycolate phosphatase
MLCGGCGANARARLLWLFLKQGSFLQAGTRVLHVAPEEALAPRIRDIVGAGYEPVDISPEDYPHVPGIRKFDLSSDAAELPSRHYDLIIHSHVMEHVRCNITALLFHLTRALKDDGSQVCCIPVMRDQTYEEDLSELNSADATQRFGQHDHVRRFGALDLEMTLGMLFRLPRRYDLLEHFTEAQLIEHRIPRSSWMNWSPNSVLVLGRTDLLLKL